MFRTRCHAFIYTPLPLLLLWKHAFKAVCEASRVTRVLIKNTVSDCAKVPKYDGSTVC